MPATRKTLEDAVNALPTVTVTIATSIIHRRPRRSESRATTGVARPPRFLNAINEDSAAGLTPSPRAMTGRKGYTTRIAPFAALRAMNVATRARLISLVMGEA